MNAYTPTTDEVRDAWIAGTFYDPDPDAAEFDRWLHEVRADERERIARAIVDELARTTATARPEVCEFADEGYCHAEAREQALEDAARIARQGGDQ